MEELLAPKLKESLVEKELAQDDLLHFLNDEEKRSIHKTEGALLTLYTEARRRKWTRDQLRKYIEGLHLKANVDKLMDGYEESKATIDECLNDTVIRRARLASFRVETFYEVYNSKTGRVGQPKCLVELGLIKVDNNEDKFKFICNTNELQALASNLRDMRNILSKIGS